jgi:hypothetical protein
MSVYLFGDRAGVTYIKEYRQTTDTTKFFDEDDTDAFKRGAKGWLLQFSKLSPVANTAEADPNAIARDLLVGDVHEMKNSGPHYHKPSGTN